MRGRERVIRREEEEEGRVGEEEWRKEMERVIMRGGEKM